MKGCGAYAVGLLLFALVAVVVMQGCLEVVGVFIREGVR